MARHKTQALATIEPTIVTDRHPDELPARVIYSLGKGALVPAPGLDPDLPPPDFRVIANTIKGKLANGLTARADAMARMAARGVPISDAFRSAYNVRPSVTPMRVARRAYVVTKAAKYQSAVEGYRAELQEEGAQRTIPVRGFVLGRLVHEAQSAENDGARVRSLELLGKTEGMFTDVKRVEHIQDGRIDELKQRLSQRLEQIMARFSAMSPSHGDDLATSGTEPHHPSTPLLGNGSHPSQNHMNPAKRSPQSDTPIIEMTAEDLGVGCTYQKSEGPREILPEDLGL